MREIKFRFWVDGANGEFMIYPDNRENSSFNSEGWEFYLDHEGFEIINHRGVVEPAHHVPMQYTGLKDKNGMEIYEGDIIKLIGTYKDSKGKELGRHKVVWNDYYTGFYPLIDDHLRGNSEWEVIGNIYENPELLEEEE